MIPFVRRNRNQSLSFAPSVSSFVLEVQLEVVCEGGIGNSEGQGFFVCITDLIDLLNYFRCDCLLHTAEMFKVGFKADIPLFFCFFASDVSFFFCVFPIAIPPVFSFFALLPGVSLATLLYLFPPFPLLLYLCPPPRHPPCTPSPQPTESPYLSAVCLTYLSLL